MNPGIVSAAVFVVGAIAAALCYVFSEPPQAQTHSNHRNQNRDHVYNYHFNNISTNNYYPSDGSSNTENDKECRNRTKERRRFKIINDKCGICLDGLSGEVESLTCNHFYHAKCLEDYIESEKSSGGQPRCPLCRHPIESSQ